MTYKVSLETEAGRAGSGTGQKEVQRGSAGPEDPREHA